MMHAYLAYHMKNMEIVQILRINFFIRNRSCCMTDACSNGTCTSRNLDLVLGCMYMYSTYNILIKVILQVLFNIFGKFEINSPDMQYFLATDIPTY